MVPGGRDLDRFSRFLQILGGAGDINNSISMSNYCDGPYIHLLLYANKVLSAWTEVWTGTWPSSKRFWFPGVVLGRFFDVFEIAGLVISITRQVCPTTAMDHKATLVCM